MAVVALALLFLIFVTCMTVVSYKLGLTKTENARLSGWIGFLLSFLPPLALIYLVVLSLKDDAATV